MSRQQSTSQQKIYESYLPLVEVGLAAQEVEASLKRKSVGWKAWYRPWLPADKNARIVELGCGSGDFLLWLKRQGYDRCEGVEVSMQQLAIAQHLGLKNVSQGDLLDYLKTISPGVSVVFLRDILEHFSHDEVFEILSGVSRILAPGGRCIIQTPNATSPFFGSHLYGDFSHRIAFTKSSLIQVFRPTGLVPEMFFGIEPIASGVGSFLRLLAWKVVKSAIHFCLAAEKGCSDRVVTQNLVAVARKSS